MTYVKIYDKERKSTRQIPLLGNGFNISQYINDHVYIFGGDVIHCKVKLLSDSAINYIFDWFGDNAYIFTKDNVKYASIKCDEKALYYWLLQYCESVEVIEPVEIRQKLLSTFEKQVELYKK